MKNLLFFVVMMFTVELAPAWCMPPGSPVVFILSADRLQKNKAAIRLRNADLLPAYTALLQNADKALLEGPFSVMEKKNNPPSGDKHDYMSLAPYFWPDSSKKDGLPYIRKDGQINPEVKDYQDKEYMPRLCDLVSTLALAYYYSGQEKYAEHAAKLIRVWFLNADTKMNPNLNYAQAVKGVNDGRGIGLIDVRNFTLIVDGIGLLQGSKSWPAADQQDMQKWFGDFLDWMQTSRNGKDEMNAKNNHGTYYDALRLSLALFTGKTALARDIVANATRRLDSQEDAEGKFPLEMERTISLHYSVFNLQAFFTIASMADKTGFDFWNYTGSNGASLKKAFDYLHPFLTREKEWKGQQISPFDFADADPLLLTAAEQWNCADCRKQVKSGDLLLLTR